MDDQKKYVICKYLDEQSLFIGMQYDEAVVVIPLVIVGALSGHMLIFWFCAAVAFFGIKKLKKNKGSGYLLTLLYWHLPPGFSNWLLSHFSPGRKRYWV